MVLAATTLVVLLFNPVSTGTTPVDIVEPDVEVEVPTPVSPFLRTRVAEPPPPPPQPATSGPVSYETWMRVARCESGYGGEPNWSINTGTHLDPYSDSRFWGGLQFNKSSWDWAGGTQYAYWPHQATKEQQIAVANRLLQIHPLGWGAWPACSRKLGLRR